MAYNKLLHVFLAFALLFSTTTSSSDSPEVPEISPIPVDIGADDSLSFSSPSPSIDYPYMSPPADLAPTPTLASSPSFGISPAPVPETEPEKTSDTSAALVESEKPKKSPSKGMSGGRKAGIAIGVIAAVCVVGFGGFLYKKRKQNIHRARLGYVVREDFI